MARRPLRDLPRVIQEYSEGLIGNADKTMRDVVRAASRTMISGTPADTGRARSNYIGAVSQPVFEQREPFFPGRHLGISETANLTAALADIDNRLRSFSARKHGRFVLTNSVSYLGLLNSGLGSPQSAGGFFERGLISAQSTFRSAKIMPRRV